MNLTKPVTTIMHHYKYQRQFALCESCFWCATIFDKVIKEQGGYDIERRNDNDGLQQICSTCKNKSISLIPLTKDEGYSVAVGGKRGLEMEFSRYRS